MNDDPSKLILPAGVTTREAPSEDEMIWYDKTITYSEGNQQVRITPADVLKAAGRMLRDGRSIAYIRQELDLPHVGSLAVTDGEIERAAMVGLSLLNAEIKSGKETEESRVLIDKASRPLSPDDDDE